MPLGYGFFIGRGQYPILDMVAQWIRKQWQDISGDVKFAGICLFGTACMAGALALTHGLALWQQIILGFLFVLLFGWGVVATYAATRRQSPVIEELPIGITPDNVQNHVRQWIDSFSLEHGITTWPQWHFGFRVTFGRVRVFVVRTTAHGNYLTLIARIGGIPTQQRQAFERLSPQERTQFFGELALETARAKIAFNSDPNLAVIQIEKRIQITPELTESDLMQGLQEINFSATIIWSTIALRLGQQPELPPPSSMPTTEGPTGPTGPST